MVGRRRHGRENVGLAAALPVPEFIGAGERRYEIVREISRGGMGTVHLGRLRGPLGFAKVVAIKTMHAHDVANPHVAAMFAAEARLSAQLCHANIVSTLDVLVEGGSVFIVMEYIDGRSLSQLVSGMRMPIEVACAVIYDVLLGLEHAHAHGVVHCDVSPQNILVGSDGLARILDFGIAKAMSGAVLEHDDTIVRGKVPYMAPEQLRRASIDHRVDLYAAGTTLWELLTGMRLFRGADRAELAESVLAGAVEPASKYAPEIPPSLDSFVLKATARDPRARFRSAREMANALAAAFPLACRADVASSIGGGVDMMTPATPVSGVRALSREELAIRRGTAIAKTQMSRVRKEARTSARVRLATIGLLGVALGALGAGQARFGIVPVDQWVSLAKGAMTTMTAKLK